ncbi:MAG TPA: hypothetical protein DCR55_03015 [Lentisphaeria bacterium]|jgi:hypothetical protein|nr:hypothetical protein [Lentisphaeria bacterium]
MEGFWKLYAIVGLLGGVPLSLWGYRFFRVILGPVGFFAGFLLGSWGGTLLNLSGWAALLMGLVLGTAGGLMSVATAAMVIYLFGAQVGGMIVGLPALVAIKLFDLSLPFQVMAGLATFAAALAGGMYAWHFKRMVVILWSSVVGALCVWFGLFAAAANGAGGVGSFGHIFNLSITLGTTSVLINLVCVVLLIDSILYQRKDSSGLPDLMLRNPLERRGKRSVGTGTAHSGHSASRRRSGRRR